MIRDIIVSVISVIVGSVVTFSLTQLASKNKEKKQLKRDTYDNRPEFDIINYYDYTETPGKGIDEECDIDVFVSKIKNVDYDRENDDLKINYFDDDLNKDNWCCIIYELKNAGHIDISSFDVVCKDKKYCSIFSTNILNLYIEKGFLNYFICYDKKIRVGQTVKIKFYFNNDRITGGPLSAFMSILLTDDHGSLWEQPLFLPDNKIYDSRRINYKEYKRNKSTDDAIECFKNPYLW